MCVCVYSGSKSSQNQVFRAFVYLTTAVPCSNPASAVTQEHQPMASARSRSLLHALNQMCKKTEPQLDTGLCQAAPTVKCLQPMGSPTRWSCMRVQFSLRAKYVLPGLQHTALLPALGMPWLLRPEHTGMLIYCVSRQTGKLLSRISRQRLLKTCQT